jgi:hypothetical protein
MVNSLMLLAVEANRVIALRMMKLMRGDGSARREAKLMVRRSRNDASRRCRRLRADMKAAGNCAKSAHFVSTVTFSLQLHKLHSKARTSRPSGPDTKPVNIIGP